MHPGYPHYEIAARIRIEPNLPVVRFHPTRPESASYIRRFNRKDPWGNPEGMPAFSPRMYLKRVKFPKDSKEYDEMLAVGDPKGLGRQEVYYPKYTFTHANKQYTAAKVVWEHYYPGALQTHGGTVRTINGCALDLRRENLFCTGIETLQKALANYKPWSHMTYRDKVKMRQENLAMTKYFVATRITKYNAEQGAEARAQGLKAAKRELRPPRWYMPQYDPYQCASAIDGDVTDDHFPKIDINRYNAMDHMDTASSGFYVARQVYLPHNPAELLHPEHGVRNPGNVS